MINKTAEQVASTLVKEVICNFTTPRTLISDNGTEFDNQISKELCKIFKIKMVNIQSIIVRVMVW